MSLNIIGAVVAAVIGVSIAFLNYFISKTVIKKAPDKYSLVTVARQVIQVGFLAIVYFVGAKMQNINIVYLLVGAALGMTVPMVYFTKKLLSFNGAGEIKEKKEDDVNG